MPEEFVSDVAESDEVVPFDEGGDEGYTPEEWAMIQQAHGVQPEETADPSAEVADVSTESVEPDPWEWVKDKNPDAVRKTWEQYTQTREELLREKEQLKPFQELAEVIQTDPGLQAVIRAYYEAPQGVENELLGLQSKVAELERNLTVKEEFGELDKYIAAEGLPKVQYDEIVSHAAKVHAPNLMTAYRDLKFDEIREMERESTLNEVKKTKGAAVPKINQGTKVKTGLSQKEIDNMDNDEFTRRYAEIQAFYGGNQ